MENRMGNTPLEPGLKRDAAPRHKKKLAVLLKTLRKSQIQAGVPLPMNVYDANSRLLLHRKNVLRTELRIKKLLNHGAYVDPSIQENMAEAALFSHAA